MEKLATAYAGSEWINRDISKFPNGEYLDWNNLPFSSYTSPIIGAIVYFTSIFALTRFMKDREPIQLQNLFLFHNFALCLFAIAIFVGISSSLLEFYQKHGVSATWNDPNWLLPSSKVPTWCYIFYLSKYYELLDSFFLCLKKKPLQFVQKWHHSCVLFLFWSYMNARMMNHWPLVFLNSFVHIFVYGYFVCSCLKIQVPFKSLITLLQISQFIVDMVWALPFPYLRYYGMTNGDWGPWIFGQLVGLSFVFLFWQIYKKNQQNKLKKDKQK